LTTYRDAPLSGALQYAVVLLKGHYMSKAERAIHNFNYWFNWHGHWMYSGKESAFKAWVNHGIVDLDDAPNGITFADLAQ